MKNNILVIFWIILSSNVYSNDSIGLKKIIQIEVINESSIELEYPNIPLVYVNSHQLKPIEIIDGIIVVYETNNIFDSINIFVNGYNLSIPLHHLFYNSHYLKITLDLNSGININRAPIYI